MHSHGHKDYERWRLADVKVFINFSYVVHIPFVFFVASASIPRFLPLIIRDLRLL